MRCARCQADHAPGAKFCPQCGAGLPRPCPACGHANDAAAKFCIECGSALGPAGRPQASVLFADISGYTALCARSDPEDIRAMLGRFFDVMDRLVETHS